MVAKVGEIIECRQKQNKMRKYTVQVSAQETLITQLFPNSNLLQLVSGVPRH